MAAIRELRFRAMGSEAHLLTVGAPPGALESAYAKIIELEARWSRFRCDSEISRLNICAGRPVAVSADTYLLLQRSIMGWEATAGRFDPTVLRAVVAAGYDRSFELVGAVSSFGHSRPSPTVPSPGCSGIRLDPEMCVVQLPPGVGVDPGGIGKGLTADLVVAELLASGTRGACVNLGGDVRVGGEPPSAEGWVIAVEHPSRPDEEVALVAIADGAVATSSRLARAWKRGGEPQHHLIDPSTGAPAWKGILAASVVASEAWWAEVLAKAVFVAGRAEAASVLAGGGAEGLFVDDDGRIGFSRGMKRLVA